MSVTASPTIPTDAEPEPAAAPPAPASPGTTAHSRRPAAKRRILTASLTAATVLLAIVSAGLGQLAIPVDEILGSLARHANEVLSAIGLGAVRLPVLAAPSHPNADATLWMIRFPRIAMALVVGAALAVGGALMQGVFRNPLAEPGVVGVSSGAAMAASIAIVSGATFAGPLTSPLFAFVGGLAATFLVYLAARAGGRTEVVTLVLTGIAVNAVCGAGIALSTFLSSTQQREQIVFWQLGSLNGTRWQDVAIVAPVTAIGVAGALVLAHRLDLLALGERQARHLGVSIERTRVIAIVLVAILTASAVALCGIIAFVGLVVPHLVRLLLGPGHRALITVSAVGGALLLLAADTVARTAVPYADLPIGMLTALVGGPFFFWLLRRTRIRSGGWG